MSKTVFISYAHADGTEFAEILENWLESNEVGLLAFRDTTDLQLGDEWKKVIDTAIEECFVMLVVVTQAAIQSIYVTYEWAYALGKNKRVIPLIVDSTVTENDLHPKMKDLQYMPFASAMPENWEKLKQQLTAIQAEDDTPRAVLNAVAGLSSHNPNERLQALGSLKSIKHPSVVRELKQAIQHEYPDVRARAGIFLAEVTDCKDDAAVPGLKESIELDIDVRVTTSLLVKMNNEAAAECLSLSYDMVSDYRKGNIRDAMVKFNNPCIVNHLRRIWQNSNGKEDLRILKRLADFKDEETILEIIKYIHSLQDHLKSNEVAIFDKYGDDPKIVKPLYNFMLEYPNMDNLYHRNIAGVILSILERIENPEVAELLEQALSQGYFRFYDNQIKIIIDQIKQKLNSS
ncbi:MAG: toll/interleukin-1 receptor domain-containing protein [Anaerolineaceae bacterium]|nr:toll/interleukin-1 receptor domain-containing protein [Anaerolineaceae bacterium]